MRKTVELCALLVLAVLIDIAEAILSVLEAALTIVTAIVGVPLFMLARAVKGMQKANCKVGDRVMAALANKDFD